MEREQIVKMSQLKAMATSGSDGTGAAIFGGETGLREVEEADQHTR